MHRATLLVMAFAVAISCGCATARAQLERLPGVGAASWHRVLPPEVDLETAPKPEEAYAALFSELALLEPGAPCPKLDAEAEGGDPFVLVHGIGGDGREWWPALLHLGRAHPRAIFMFRWSAQKERGALVDALARGLERLAACMVGAERIWVVAHSAGGVLASFAAGRMHLSPQAPRVEVLTVASPLAGTGMQPEQEPDAEARFLVELGGSYPPYPRSAQEVTVVHLRTHAPSDPVMRSSPSGHWPNDPWVGVRGARQVDLPEPLGHDEALGYVSAQLGDGRSF
jgi:pimeloyl-ACP methyl ester carboxylesterase